MAGILQKAQSIAGSIVSVPGIKGRTYVITDAQQAQDIVVITGTVDNKLVSVQISASQYNALPDQSSQNAYVASAMFSALPAQLVSVPQLIGTFTL